MPLIPKLRSKEVLPEYIFSEISDLNFNVFPEVQYSQYDRYAGTYLPVEPLALCNHYP